jgi:hypothetical protein
MLDETVSVLRSSWSMGLVLLGIALVFIPFLWPREFDRLLLYLALSLVCIIAGMACISLEVGALLAGFFALMFGLLAVALLRGWWYDKRFPVFATEPVWSFTDDDGCLRDLYIAETGSGFIIGMMYEVEIDDARSRLRTRWKDVFKTWRDAEDELRCRAASYGLTAATPLRDGRQPPVRGPAR